jgi:hypothetical protein
MVRAHMRGHELHAPAHLDAEVLSALGRLHRAGEVPQTSVSAALDAPRARIEALIAEQTTPKNRSEQEIAGYRDVLGLIHANRTDIPFEPRYVEQLHGSLYRYTGDTTAGHWKKPQHQA